MRVGVSLFVQNHQDWARFERQEAGEPVPGGAEIPDVELFQEELKLGHLVEPLGFDSLWTAEHHFTPYTMVTNPLQLLTYFAGATSRIDMGTMVVVLPWYNPLRVAEDMVMLQNMLGPERRLITGLGRGAGRREFGGLGVPMDESRSRFVESVEIIRTAITEDRFAHDGEHFTIAEVSLRPKPRDSSLLDDLHCAWGSPKSALLAAEMGLKPMIIPQKAWAEYDDELAEFARIRAEHNHPQVQPAIAIWVYCAASEEQAKEGAHRYLPEYADSAMRHYELAGSHFADIKGYEHYAAIADSLGGGSAGMGQVWLDNHVWGTPAECVEQIAAINDHLSPSELIIVPRYGTMPHDEAESSLRLFADEVLPAVKDMKPVVTAAG